MPAFAASLNIVLIEVLVNAIKARKDTKYIRTRRKNKISICRWCFCDCAKGPGKHVSQLETKEFKEKGLGGKKKHCWYLQIWLST